MKEKEALHEEDFWSTWLREDDRGKEGRMAKAERKEEEKKGRGERRERNGDR